MAIAAKNGQKWPIRRKKQRDSCRPSGREIIAIDINLSRKSQIKRVRDSCARAARFLGFREASSGNRRFDPGGRRAVNAFAGTGPPRGSRRGGSVCLARRESAQFLEEMREFFVRVPRLRDDEPHDAFALVSLQGARPTYFVPRLHVDRRRDQRDNFLDVGISLPFLVESRQLLVEVPRDPQLRLAKPAESTERTDDLYRFAVSVAAGKQATLEVVFEKDQATKISLLNAGAELLDEIAAAATVEAKIKDELRTFRARREECDAAAARIVELSASLRKITDEQSRIRGNMSSLDKKSESNLSNRYAKKLLEQEDRIEAIQAEIEKTHDIEKKLRAKLRDDFGTTGAEEKGSTPTDRGAGVDRG